MRDGHWAYTVKGYAGGKHKTAPLGALLLETTHTSTASKDIEISAWRSRMARGEVSHVEVIQHVDPWKQETIYS